MALAFLAVRSFAKRANSSLLPEHWGKRLTNVAASTELTSKWPLSMILVWTSCKP